MSKNPALCPECGKPMRFDRNMDAWDCGPNDEGGHGYWDPSPSLERLSDRQAAALAIPADPFADLPGSGGLG